MSKKWWLLLILIIIVGVWLVASKYVAGVDPWLGENIGTPVIQGFVNMKNSVVASPTWQTWIAPNVAPICFTGGLIVMFVGYRWASAKKLPFSKPKVTAEQPMTTPVPQQTYVPPQPTVTVTPTPAVTPTPIPIEPTPEPEKPEETPVVA